MEDKWISVTESLPEYKERVLVWGESKNSNPQMGGAYCFITSRRNLRDTIHDDRMLDENDFYATYVTHWQPLLGPKKIKNMKYLTISILFIFWAISTIILALSILGITVFLFEDNNYESYWFIIGEKLLNKLLK